jgi:hypothetical protein
MRCPDCTLENLEGAVECTRCGLELAQWMGKHARHAPQPAVPASGLQPVAPARSRPGRDVSARGRFINCPHCRLQYRLQPDGECPNCHTPIDTSLLPPSPDPLPRSSSTIENIGNVTSAAFFILNAAVTLLNRDNLPAGKAIFIGIGASLVTGIGLLLPLRSLRSLAQVAAVGLPVLVAIGATIPGMHGWALIGILTALANGVLIFGRVSIPRIVLATSCLSLLLVFGALASTRNVSTIELAYKISRTIQGQPLSEIKGQACGYQLRLPPSARWFEPRIRPATADKVLFSPAQRAAIIVNVERLPEADIGLQDLGDAWLKHVRSTSTSLEAATFDEVERKELFRPVPGILLQVQYVEAERSYTMLAGLLRNNKTLFIVNCILRTADYPKLADELRAMLDTFVPANAPEPAAASPTTRSPAAQPAVAIDPATKCRNGCQYLTETCFCPRDDGQCKQSCRTDYDNCVRSCLPK